ncbi:phenylacetate--CoA ligase family protein [Calderihabitans maritimus]|uniref:Coenzyme F390 synthetase n=1 Tax=Calderihabitans maritimus TaxID=1246530 RepID=A0A1Z5HUV9_9FIRM|nr:phenylacetate--CoA ligase family protein [Calderihabitans maritimus]GAW93302.1 hypothetical protein KKC1_24390 [Calderihabitans maritimus]
MEAWRAVGSWLADVFLWLRGFPVRRTASFLMSSQWWEPEELKRYQDELLRRLIRHAYDNVPYYREVMQQRKLTPADFNGVEDLVKLPVLSKDEVRKNYHRLEARDCRGERFIRTTGGTTGEPLRVVTDKHTGVWSAAAFRRGYSWAGYRPGSGLAKLTGGSLGPGKETWRQRLRSWLTGEIFLPAFELSRENVKLYVEKIKNRRVRFLRGYTSTVYQLATLIREAGLRLTLEAVFTTAETIHPFQRQTIIETFGCPVFDGYGCGEINSVAFECEEHRGLHISQENVVVECLRGGERVKAGEMGKVTLTDLRNYAMPIIRYQNDDLASFATEPCSCGRGLPLLEKIHGRSNDFLVAADGRLVSGSFIPHLFRHTCGIRQVQVEQAEDRTLTIRMVKGPAWSLEEEKMVVQLLQKYLGGLEMHLEYVPEILPTPSGKLKFVISRAAEQIF